MQCGAVMSRGVVRLSPEDSVLVASQKMRDENVGFLPVCGEDGTMLGMLTDRDIVVRVVASGGVSADIPVRQVMTHGAISCRVDDEIGEARLLMDQHHVRRLPVTDDLNRLLGIISASDIMPGPASVSETWEPEEREEDEEEEAEETKEREPESVFWSPY